MKGGTPPKGAKSALCGRYRGELSQYFEVLASDLQKSFGRPFDEGLFRPSLGRTTEIIDDQRKQDQQIGRDSSYALVDTLN